ncbi:MAG: diaminopimelate epimerase [Spirochaetes bacterium]|nr:diaminopimelate epimerase [Spirochaetota bacterium]
MDKPLPFTKMSGLGNDFIIIDNRTGIIEEKDIPFLAQKLCTPRFSLGGDELMLIEHPRAGGNYTMRTVNPDGTEVKMCGNASRCVARYAFIHGIAGRSQVIDTLGGPVEAYVDETEVRVGLQVTSGPVFNVRLKVEDREFLVHTAEISGAPHAVVFLEQAFDCSKDLIHRWGSALRYHPYFPEGTNVNFIEVKDRHTIYQRTFERGVEGETMACGTGATASGVVCGALGLVDSPVMVRVLGGNLSVSFEREAVVSPVEASKRHFIESQKYKIYRPFLGGGARFVAEGTLHPEAWQW